MYEVESQILEYLRNQEPLSSQLTNIYSGKVQSLPSVPFLLLNYTYQDWSSICNRGFKVALACTLKTPLPEDQKTSLLTQEVIRAIPKIQISSESWHLVTALYQNHSSQHKGNASSTKIYFDLYIRRKKE